MSDNIFNAVGDFIAREMNDTDVQRLLEIFKVDGNCEDNDLPFPCSACPICYDCAKLIATIKSTKEIQEKTATLAYAKVKEIMYGKVNQRIDERIKDTSSADELKKFLGIRRGDNE